MCKILVMSGLKPEVSDLAWEFIEEMGGVMSKGNNDGLGYTAVDQEGKMFGERWHNNYDAFDYRPISSSVLSKFNKFLEGENKRNTYNKFGSFKKNISAITLHTRMATSGKEFQNTHPFVDLQHDTSVIHNGIITNHSKEDQIRSTCDSERILNKYIEHKVMKNPNDIQKMVKDLTGYFACGIVSRDRDDRRVIDVFKSHANLNGLFIKQLGVFVFATSADDVENVCRTLGLTITYRSSVKENTLMRLDALTGEPIFFKEYTYNRYSSYTPSYEQYWNRETKPVSEQDWRSSNVKDFKEAKDIVSKHDILNENEAAKYGYYYDKPSGLWTKKNKEKV